MTRYLVGIDNGSQSSKVTIFDERGTVVASGRQRLRAMSTPAPGVVEHPGDDLWESVAAACRQAMAGFDGDPAAIAGVGLCAIRFCRALLRADGSLAHPVLSWMDERVSRPHEQVDASVARVTTASGYLTHRMTGAFRDSIAAYQGMWPVDPRARGWLGDGPEFDRFGLERGQLFETVEPGAVLGRLTAEAAAATGLPVGVSVVATANDKAVEALGSGLADADALLLSLGTYIAGMTVGAEIVDDPSGFWCNFGATPGGYLYESTGIRRGMGTVSWYRDLLGDPHEAIGPAGAADAAGPAGPSAEELLGRGAAEVPVGSDGLLAVLDWLAPTDEPHRRGALVGFDARHGRFHIHRSLLEAIALTMHRHAEQLARGLGHPFRRVLVTGGGASSDLLVQIVADVFDLPTERARVTDAAGLGAALCAAVGSGVHPSFEAARAAMIGSGETFSPDAASHAVYRDLGPIHRDVARQTESIHRRTAALVG